MALAVFLVIQLCDFATTLVFVHCGVAEANPLVAAALRMAAGPVIPLAGFKLAGCALGFLAWRCGRMRLLRAANLMFGLCVVWNLVAVAFS